ncbi:hypothetical protein Tco_1430440 [Tanacetum coccineum]
MDDRNITMEEYIRLEEEKARRHGKMYNWETATYGRIWDDDEVYNLRSVETEFPAIVFDDTFTSQVSLSCEPMVSPLNDNEIDFRISFHESDDEDYTVILDKTSFSYKIISIDDLKMDSENDNDKVNMHSFLSPEPMVSYFDDLDYLKDFDPQHINESNLKDETSLSKYDEEEQNILYFNDLFPFNVIYPDNSKSNKDNDDKPWGDVSILPLPDKINTDVGAYAQGSNKLLKINMALPPRDQRHQYLMFEGLKYTDADITDFEDCLRKIYCRGIHRVLVLDFESLSAVMAEGLTSRILMEHRDLGGAKRCMSWRQFILDLRLHIAEEMETAGFGLYWAESARQIFDKGDLSGY